jgi:NADH-quinone oxidoreductase subunit N
MFGFVLVITAMFFKISAAPFHMWTPDVYEGSASIVATFFATAAKFTTIMALLNLMIKVALGWNGIGKIFIFVALLSLVVGSFGAIFQKNLKRLLAYSSIGHVGFILLGLAAFNKQSLVACVLYAIIYAIISVGSFGFLLLMKSKSGNDNDKENEKTFAISSLSGLNKTNPIMAFCLAILMFSTAGIPPLAGFFSKFYILAGALQNGLIIPSIIAVLFSVISAYYYLRIVKIMYFDEPQNNMVLEDVGNVRMIIFLSAILNLVLIFFLSSLQASITNFFPL